MASDPDSGKKNCACGITVDRWVRGEGFWHAIGFGLFFPLVGLAFHGGLLAAAIFGVSINLGIRFGLGVVPVLVVIISLAVQRHAGHRGWCWLGRSAYFFLLGPGLIILVLGG